VGIAFGRGARVLSGAIEGLYRNIVALLVLSSLLLAVPAYASFSNNYSFRRTITIDHAKVANSDQSDFPVLISGTYPFLAKTANGGGVLNESGYDIIFTSDAAGQNRLDHEVDSYDSATGKASFWVRIPTLSHTSDTVIYIFYGNPAVASSQENKAGVWSNNYKSVYHLGDGANVNVNDSGVAGYNLSGSANAVAGYIGGGAGFSGNSNSYLAHSSVSTYPSGKSPVTIEAWFRLAASGTVEILGYGSNSSTGSRIGLWWNGGTLSLEFENLGVGASLPYDTNWHHAVGCMEGERVRRSTSTEPNGRLMHSLVLLQLRRLS
jgi:hypothetical protein